MNIQKIKVTNVKKIQPIKVHNAQSITFSLKTQEKNAIPSKVKQIIKPDTNYDALSKVVVNEIPSDYIIPMGEKEIIENGEYDVKEIEKVNVNVESQPKLQDKSISVNPNETKQIMADANYDGLGVVEVTGTINLETKEVTPTKETQTINRSENKYIESVTINPIPEDYIIPIGELKITENGSYDVKDKASVKVETSGADLSEYFDEYKQGGFTTTAGGWLKSIKKIPAPTGIATNLYSFFAGFQGESIDLSKIDIINLTSFNSTFSYCINLKELDLSIFDLSKINNMASMLRDCKNITNINFGNSIINDMTNLERTFNNCESLTSLDLSTFYTPNLTNLYTTFSGCKKLMYLDIRNFTFDKVTSSTSTFGASASNGVPDNCLIIVKDDTAKEWVTSKFSRLTNVKTVAELGE